MKQIVVTGGAGFIGANLCGRLLDAGHHVTCLDNFASSSPANVLHLQDRANFRLVVGDVRAPLRFDGDEIYHLACPASPPRYQADPVFTAETAVLGTINVLDMARRTGAKVLHASTSEIYGEALTSPQEESYRGNVNCWGPRACYDEGKRCAEALCHDYRERYRVDVRVVRIFNTYGPRMDPEDGRVISNLIVQALAGHPMTIYGDGGQTRSFCFIDDLLDGFERVMQADPLNGPVNLGNPDEISVLDLAALISEAVGRQSSLCFESLPRDDPTHRCPDIGLAQRKLHWRPRVHLQDGLRATVAYFGARLSGTPALWPVTVAAE